MSVVRLVERVEQPFAGVRVDREKGVIFGAKLCGLSSANGSDYPADMFRRDVAKYDGAVVNYNHNLRGEPKVEGVGGRIRNPRVGADGTPRGDVHLLRSHPNFPLVMEAAESDPGLFGFSHVADCQVRPGQNGRQVVEGLNEVVSVDLVARPATTKGIFEGKGVPVTYAQLVEFVTRHPESTEAQILRAKRLREDMGGDAMAMDAAPAPESDPDEAIKSGFKTAIMAVVEKAMTGEMDPKDALKKIKGLLSSHGDVSDKGDSGDDTGDDYSGDDMSKESKAAPAVDYPGILTECIREGYQPGPAELKALALLPTAEDRKAFVTEQRAKVPADKVKSAARQPGSSTVTKTEQQQDNKPVPTDGKTFAESIRAK